MPNRDYKKEYSKYQGTAEQKKKRASRNSARSAMVKMGKVRKGDGKDVDHKNGNPKDNAKKNLRVTTKRANRSFPRNSKAGKK
tara:strand:+ start:218 stop:466 length:249 start_codon:yes stop_codon:yes gene_type:complete